MKLPLHASLLLILTITTCIGADLQVELRKNFDQACQSNKFMGVASLTVSGDTIFSAACGWADAGRNIKNTVDTRFRIASITKEFTAAAVLLLLEEKKFSLTDPIGKFIPDLPESWRSATIHQLLTHTSGVPIYTASPELKTLEKDERTPNELLNLVLDQPLLFPHGTKFSYNNTGYILLGLFIEKMSGLSYARFVQDRILDRLGMKDSGFDFTHKIIAKKAQGYTLVGNELQNAAFVDATSAWSAGGLYSTVHDLTLWSDALAHRTMLNADSTERMFRTYPEAASQDPYHQIAHYGYGIVLAERFNHRLQYHGGGITGYNSVLQRYPEVNMVIAVLSNLDSDSDVLPSWTLGDGLAEIWFAAQPK